MNTTPNSNRKHIGIYGNTNSGKSSLMNTILGQDISLVSSVEGTTTDPVQKAMELVLRKRNLIDNKVKIKMLGGATI